MGYDLRAGGISAQHVISNGHLSNDHLSNGYLSDGHLDLGLQALTFTAQSPEREIRVSMEAAEKRRAKGKEKAQEEVIKGAPERTSKTSAKAKGSKTAAGMTKTKKREKKVWEQGHQFRLKESVPPLAGPSHPGFSQPNPNKSANTSSHVDSAPLIGVSKVLQLAPTGTQALFAPKLLGGDRTLAVTDFKSLPWHTDLMAQSGVEGKWAYVAKGFKRACVAVFRDTNEAFKRMGIDNTHLGQILIKNGVKMSTSANTPVHRTIWNCRLLEVVTMWEMTPGEINDILQSRSFTRSRFHCVAPVAGLRDLEHWPQLIRDLEGDINGASKPFEQPPALQSYPESSHQLRLLLWQTSNYQSAGRKSHLAKVIENLSAVVLYISVFKSGKADIPSDSEQLRSHLTELAVDAGYKDEFTQQIAGVKYVRSAARLRGPVYAALAISPLILLANCELTGNEVKRVDLVQHWMHMGNRYPRLVREIEFMLWFCIKRTVDGVMDIHESFKAFAAEAVERLEGSSLGSDDELFFHQKFGESFDKKKAERVLAAFIEELPERPDTSASIESVRVGEIEDADEGSHEFEGLEAGETSKDQEQNVVEGEGMNGTPPDIIETPEAEGDIAMGEADERASERDGANGISVPTEDSEDRADAASQVVKLALDASKETKVTASAAAQIPVRNGDVTMDHDNPSEQADSVKLVNTEEVGKLIQGADERSGAMPASRGEGEGMNGTPPDTIETPEAEGDISMGEVDERASERNGANGISAPAEDSEDRADAASQVAGLALNASKETKVTASAAAQIPVRDGDVTMEEFNPSEQADSVKLVNTEGVGKLIQGADERPGAMPANQGTVSSQQTGNSNGVNHQEDVVFPTNVYGEQAVEDREQGRRKDHDEKEKSRVRVWIGDGYTCIDGSDLTAASESDDSESDNDNDAESDVDADTDDDIKKSILANVARRGGVRLKGVQPQAKASSRARTKASKRKGSAKQGGRKHNAKRKPLTKRSKTSPAKAPGEIVDSEPARLKLGKAPKRFVGPEFRLVDYEGGEPFAYTPETYALSDLQDIIKLLNEANATNTDYLETADFFSQPNPKTEEEPSPSHPRPHPTLRVITHEELLKLSRRQLQSDFRQAHILIKGRFIPEHEQQWSEANMSAIGDMDELRQMHALWLRGKKGSLPNDQIRLGTFRDILDQGLLQAGIQLNCLDIPGLPGHDGYKPTQLQTDSVAYQNTRRKGEAHPYPTDVHFWHLLATKHCSHYAHIDTSGYATMIAPQIGAKLFFMLVPAGDLGDFERANGSLLFAETSHSMDDEIGMAIVAVILRPGDVLLMRPCTYHYVVTLDNSLCHGSHFMCSSTMSDTCYGIFHDFTHHDTITNQDDVHYRVTLAQMAIFWKKRIVDSRSQLFSSRNADCVEDLPNVKTVGGFLDFLTVYNVIVLGSLIWPERHRGDSLDEGVIKLYAEAKDSVEQTLAFLNAKAKIELVNLLDEPTQELLDLNDAVPLPSGKTRIYDIRDEYLVHQILSLHDALKKVNVWRASLFRKGVLQDLRHFPPEVRKKLNKLIDTELENSCYNWPGRYRPGLQWALVWTPSDGKPVYSLDQYDGPYAGQHSAARSKHSSHPLPQPSSVPQSPECSDVQVRDRVQESPPLSPGKDMDVDDGGTLPGRAKWERQIPSTEVEMHVHGGDGLAMETNREGGETPRAEGDMDVDRSQGVVGKAEGEESSSTEANRDIVTSKMTDLGQDNQETAETGGTGELIEEPRDDHSNTATSSLAGAVGDESDSDIEWVSNSIPLKRVLRTEEAQRKRIKVDHPLQMTRGLPKNLSVEPTGTPWFVGFELRTLDQETRCRLSQAGAGLLYADNMKRLEVSTEMLNDDIVEFAAFALQILHRDEHCALFGPLLTEKLMGRMRADNNCETWPTLRKGKWPYWDKPIWVFTIFLRDTGHWALSVVKAETRQILMFDSLGLASELEAATRRVQLAIQRAVQDAEEHGHTIAFPSVKRLEDWTVTQLQPRAVQTTNYVECGLWILFVASGVFRGYDYCQMHEKYVPQFREFLACLARLAKLVPPPDGVVTPSPTGLLSPKTQFPALHAEDRTSLPITDTPCGAAPPPLPEGGTTPNPPPIRIPHEDIQTSSQLMTSPLHEPESSLSRNAPSCSSVSTPSLPVASNAMSIPEPQTST
ncbi:hypothetical protein V5O48_002440 [Marasmius crinis-equi]|uniref:Ubiquitin-like protease family profile domain-containing protein n=1 Tax=Marasmius crinis-equi TaxID=585013 RepID=A0ABR3FVN0_9AGAR